MVQQHRTWIDVTHISSGIGYNSLLKNNLCGKVFKFFTKLQFLGHIWLGFLNLTPFLGLGTLKNIIQCMWSVTEYWKSDPPASIFDLIAFRTSRQMFGWCLWNNCNIMINWVFWRVWGKNSGRWQTCSNNYIMRLSLINEVMISIWILKLAC